jgi:GTP-binding protein Era
LSEIAIDATRCGFIAILGAPNVGKSTLLNRLVGTKVSIVSPKVQTTRSRVLGIVLRGPAQIIFIDTPGIFTPRRRLDRAMIGAAWGGASDADAVLLLIDAVRGIDKDSRAIVDRLKTSGRRALLALNKIDLVPKPKLLDLASRLDAEGIFNHIYMISAATGDGVEELLGELDELVAPGPWMFPEDQVSDMPMRLLAAEITREKLFLQLHQELPYAATVETETWDDRKDGSAAIEQVIYVRRESQRAIILGHKGARIKSIGAAARLELEEILEKRVHLFLFVKVREKWEDDPERYRDWGLDFNA